MGRVRYGRGTGIVEVDMILECCFLNQVQKGAQNCLFSVEGTLGEDVRIWASGCYIFSTKLERRKRTDKIKKDTNERTNRHGKSSPGGRVAGKHREAVEGKQLCGSAGQGSTIVGACPQLYSKYHTLYKCLGFCWLC